MNIKLNKWQGKNGQVRVYVNGAAARDVKVFVVDGGTTGHYSAGYPEIVVYSDSMMSRSDKDSIIDRVDAEVRELLSADRAPTFSDYLALAA